MAADKLIYFNARGAAEIIRLIYVVEGKEFDDVRVEFGESWQKMKHKMPMKALPVLETGGKTYCQSGAIARYLAKKSGLFGSNDDEAFAIDEVYECVQDAVRETYKFAYGDDEAAKAKALEKFTKETLPNLHDYIANKLKPKKDGKGFLVGDKLTLADLAVFVYFNNLTLFKLEHLWKKYPAIEMHHDLIESQGKIKAWLDKRPVTQF